MKNADKANQGNADGLCGFYALINFLVFKEIVEGDQQSGATARHEAFRYLAEAAERIGLWNASRVSRGYEWPELIAIFNECSSHRFFGYTAVPLIHFDLPNNIIKFNLFLREVVDDGGAAVVLVEDGGHWVLVHARKANGTMSAVDPTHGKAVKELNDVASFAAGLVILADDGNLTKEPQ